MEPGYYWVREKRLLLKIDGFGNSFFEWQGSYWPWEIGKISKDNLKWVYTTDSEYGYKLADENLQFVGPLVLPEPSS